MEEIKKDIIVILNNYIPRNLKSSLTMESDLINDLSFDSLKLLSLSVELESKINFDIIKASEEVDMTQVRTVNDILNMVIRYQKA